LPGQRPVVPVQTRYQWRYLVGFVHPQSGRTLWQTASTVNTDVFTVELAAFAEQAGAGPNHEIVLVLDRAGWHTSARVMVPDHVHLTFLPPYSPEVQPVERLWTLSNAPLVNRHFRDLQELDDVQMAGCLGLQARCDAICDEIKARTCFDWWPLVAG
jgi:transposase